jgi:hypothetical protein
VVFETRWAMSYLRGPLTRGQIKTLMDGRRGGTESGAAAPAAASAAKPAGVAPPPSPSRAAPPTGRPTLPPDVPQHFLPARGARAGSLVYQPMLLGAAQVRFTDAKRGVDVAQDGVFLTAITDEALAVDWEQAREVSVALGDLETEPAAGAEFGELPGSAGKKKSFEGWSRDFTGWLFRTRRLELHVSPELKLASRPDESEGDFRARIQHAGREGRDEAVEALRKRYAPKLAALQERIRRAQQATERESSQATQQGLQVAISLGATVLGALLGRKAVSATTLGRATTAARGAGRAMKEAQDVSRAKDTVESLQQALADLEAELKAETEAVAAKSDPGRAPLETLALKPTKQNVTVRLVTLAWAPHRRDAQGALVPAWE